MFAWLFSDFTDFPLRRSAQKLRRCARFVRFARNDLMEPDSNVLTKVTNSKSPFVLKLYRAHMRRLFLGLGLGAYNNYSLRCRVLIKVRFRGMRNLRFRKKCSSHGRVVFRIRVSGIGQLQFTLQG